MNISNPDFKIFPPPTSEEEVLQHMINLTYGASVAKAIIGFNRRTPSFWGWLFCVGPEHVKICRVDSVTIMTTQGPSTMFKSDILFDYTVGVRNASNQESEEQKPE